MRETELVRSEHRLRASEGKKKKKKTNGGVERRKKERIWYLRRTEEDGK